MNAHVYFAIIGLLVSCVAGRAIDDAENDVSGDNVFGAGNNWVKIREAPAERIPHRLGDTIELECIATGSPAPSIQWVRGDKPIHEEVHEANKAATGIIVSRLVIDHISPTERTFTCVARAGSKMTTATTTIYPVQDDLEMLALGENKNAMGQKNARIVTHYKSIISPIGQSVLLPCRVTGRPFPQIRWRSPSKKIIGFNHPRMTITPEGSLLISPLEWVDMGVYTCEAENSLSEDKAETFVYPAAP